MNVLFATSEARPYIASGGLADVSGALPKALCAAGADCRVILPLYSDIPQNLREETTFLESFTVRLSWRELYCGLFTALIAVGAFIKIPIPVVPFTLQYLFTLLAGLLLGSRRGSLSVIAYVILGLAGLPIFSEGGGLWYIFKPSFGYLIGFCAGTFLTGYLAEHMK